MRLKFSLRGSSEFPDSFYHAVYASTCRRMATFFLITIRGHTSQWESHTRRLHVKEMVEPVPLVLVKIATFTGRCWKYVLDKSIFSEVILKSSKTSCSTHKVTDLLIHFPFLSLVASFLWLLQILFIYFGSLLVWVTLNTSIIQHLWLSKGKFIWATLQNFRLFLFCFFAFLKTWEACSGKIPLLNLMYSRIIQLLWLRVLTYVKTEDVC